jgi:polar amino acid transport system substrate-binding protein
VSRAGRVGTFAAAAAFALFVAWLLGGCAPQPAAPTPKPQIAPPLIGRAGELRVGVDLAYPPFGGIVDGREAGLDVDVASALAGRLGLKAQIVDVKASDIASALVDGRIDVGLSAPFTEDLLSRATIAGTYVTDAPGLFSTATSVSVTPTSSPGALDRLKLAAQQDSEAYWRLVEERGSGGVASFPTLREAMAALARGDVSGVGADALVGAYIARDYPTIRYAGAFADARPLGAAVSAENSRLGDSVRKTLDSLAADGVLNTIRMTWVGPLPKLPSAVEDSTSVLATAPSAP